MAKTAILVLVIQALFGCTPNLIGQTVPPYPTGMTSNRGACVGKDWSCEYAIAILHKAERIPVAVLGQRNAHRHYQGKPVWHVTDQLNAPELRANEILEPGQCRMNGVRVWGLVAVVKYEGADWSPASSWARQLNMKTGKFETISPAGVTCWTGLG